MTQEIYTTTGSYTWTCPAGVTSIKVECWGGGGGGDDGTDNGGSGGAYARLDNYSVSPTQQYALFIGEGGPRSDGGQDSTFEVDVCIAVGGTVGAEAPGPGASTGDQTYAGGNGSSAEGPDPGAGGGGAGDGANGGNAESTTGGAGGVSGGGAGGDAGFSGNQPGGGNSGTGTKGGDGQIIITYDIPGRRSYSSAGYYTSSYPAGF